MARQNLTIAMLEGTASAGLFRPERPSRPEAQPGVVLYMDGFGIRAALDEIAERLAEAGYVVLVPDLLYRVSPYGPFDAKTAFLDPALRARIMKLTKDTTQEMTRSDSGVFLNSLREAGATGRIGVVGYCLGGGRALHAAAAYPDRIAACASFHGGHLASDEPDSPHRHVAAIKGHVYIGTAGVDTSFPPEQSGRLAEALRRAEVSHTIENYIGMAHGWAVPDHAAFDARGAERHWKRLLTLFEEALV